MRTIQIKQIEQNIPMDSPFFYNLIIENSRLLRDFLFDLSEECSFFNYIGEQKTTFHDDAYFVENPLYASLDSKKADSLLQKEISSRITYDQKEEYESLMNLVYDYINSISYDYPIPVTFNDDLPLQTLLKTMGLTPELTEVTDINKLIQNIKILSYLLKKDIFVFFNLKDFFSEGELLVFLKAMAQLEVKILIISSHSSPKLKDERQIIIDKDLCELHIC